MNVRQPRYVYTLGGVSHHYCGVSIEAHGYPSDGRITDFATCISYLRSCRARDGRPTLDAITLSIVVERVRGMVVFYRSMRRVRDGVYSSARRGEGGGPRSNAGRVVPRRCYNGRLLLEGQPLSFRVLSRGSRRDGLLSFRPLAGFGCVTSAFGWASTPSAMSKRAGLVRSLWGSRLNRNGRGGWTCVPLDRICLHGDTR